MQQWEYKVEMITPVSCSKAELNKYGEDGWELVGMYKESGYTYAVFKRPA